MPRRLGLQPVIRRSGGPRGDWMPSREIATAAIITADRPRLLARCLESLVSNCALGRSQPRILIVDGSRQDRNRVVNRRNVRESAARTQLKVDYVGPVQARALRARLAARGIPRRTLRFGLTPGGTGANRNIAVLMAGGSNLLMIDDDLICAPWSLAARESGVTIAGTAELRDIRFFPTRRAALRMGRAAPISLVDAHGQLLEPLRAISSPAPWVTSSPRAPTAFGRRLKKAPNIACGRRLPALPATRAHPVHITCCLRRGR